jgi:eukaryotic-like serine/threonine-protein kinase
VIGKLGEGGMGTVYLSRDTRNQQVFALKTIKGIAATNERLRISLIREAASVARLDHPNIVRVYDVGQKRGVLYVVMEHLRGASLDRLIGARFPLSLRRRLTVLIQMCEGLDHAHRNGIVHRDVKPANTFVLQDKTVKVLDFGMAAHIQIEAKNQKWVGGTPPYMSPEQVMGTAIDCRTDIWSAGVVFFELLAGRNLYQSRTFQGLEEQILRGPIPGMAPQFHLKREFDRVFALALAKDRENRYGSAARFAEDLRALVTLVENSSLAPRNQGAVVSPNLEQETVDDLPKIRIAAQKTESVPTEENSCIHTMAWWDRSMPVN